MVVGAVVVEVVVVVVDLVVLLVTTECLLGVLMPAISLPTSSAMA